jgi:hypothetical protein
MKQEIIVTSTRITARSKTPFLARIKEKEHKGLGFKHLIIFVPEIIAERGMPPFARTTIVQGMPKSKYHQTGETMIVNNFKCLEKIEIVTH